MPNCHRRDIFLEIFITFSMIKESLVFMCMSGMGRITLKSNDYNYNYFQTLQLQLQLQNTFFSKSNDYNYNYFGKVINYFLITFN